MSLDTTARTAEDRSVRAGTAALVLGLLFAASTAWILVLSLSDAVDAPNRVRAPASVGIPLGFFGTPIASWLARQGPGRSRASIGLSIALLTLVACVVLLNTAA